jgi:hypothetical protein
MSHRDAYLSEKAEQDAEMEADRKADEKYEKERLNDPVAYFEWLAEFKTPRLQTYQRSVSSPRLQTYPGSSGENGSASVPR